MNYSLLLKHILFNIKKKKSFFITQVSKKNISLLKCLKKVGVVNSFRVLKKKKLNLVVKISFVFLNFKPFFNKVFLYPSKQSFNLTYGSLKILLRKNLNTQFIILSKGVFLVAKDVVFLKKNGQLKILIY